MAPPRDSDDVDRLRRGPGLGPVDPEELARAAGILRDRTMSLEEEDVWPAKRLVVTLVVVTTTVAVMLVVFRIQVKAFLGLN